MSRAYTQGSRPGAGRSFAIGAVFALLVAGLSVAPPSQAVDDGLVTGPYGVVDGGYDLGDEAVALPGLGGRRVEMRAASYLPVGAPGPRPVVLLLHGGHPICDSDDFELSDGVWPCPSGISAIPSFAGYAEPAQLLASHGYAVFSVSANGVNASDWETSSDVGATARGQLILEHLSFLDQLNRGERPDGAPTDLAGRLDLSNVGLMGHSKGGEGVVRAAMLNAQSDKPFGIRALVPLSPINFNRFSVPGVPMAVIMGYCDGDIPTLEGQMYVDDARSAFQSGDDVLRASVVIDGANHNFFNAVWNPFTGAPHASDDWDSGVTDGNASLANDPTCGYGQDRDKPRSPTRLTDTRQSAIGSAYISAFFRLALGGESELIRYFDGSGSRPSSVGANAVWVSAALPRSLRADIATFDDPARTYEVRGNGRVQWCAGTWPSELVPPPDLPACVSDPNPNVAPHWGWSPAVRVPNVPALTAAHFAWDSPGSSLIVPVSSEKGRALAGGQQVSVKAAADPTSAHSVDMTLTLHDRAGRESSVPLARYGDVFHSLPGTSFSGLLPKTLLREVQVPLSDFTGVDLAQVDELRITPTTESGAAYLSDLAVLDAPGVGHAEISSHPVLSVHDSAVTTENTATVTVTLSAPSAEPVSAWLTVNWFRPFDVPDAGYIAFAPGETEKKITFPLRDELLQPGADESLELILAKNHNATLGVATGFVHVSRP